MVRVSGLLYTIILILLLSLFSCASVQRKEGDFSSSFDPTQFKVCEFPDPQPLENVEDYQNLLTEMYNNLLNCDYQFKLLLKSYLLLYTHSE